MLQKANNTKAQNTFTGFLALVFFIMPFGKHLLTNIALLGFIVCCFIYFRKKDYLYALKNVQWLVFALFIGWYLVSLFWSSSLDEGLRQIQVKLGLLILPFFILAAGSLLQRHHIERVKMAFVLGCAGVLTACFTASAYKALQIGSHIRLSPGGTYTQNLFTYQALSENFMHPGYLATYIGLALIILLVNITTHTKRKWWQFILIVYFFAGMVLLQGRINLLALLIVLGVSALVYAFSKRAYFIFWLAGIPVLMLVAFLFFAPANLKERYFQMPDFSYDISGNDFNSATFRLAEWTCAADVIGAHPIIGTGVGDNRSALQEAYIARNFKQGVLNKFNAHNQYLETTIATGYIGLLILFSIFIIYAYRAVKVTNHTLLLSVFFFALCILTESMLERAWAITLFSSLFPLLASSKQGNAD